MKGHTDKTKVVVRHLPPTISQATFLEQIDLAFAARYNWVSFRPGKSSQKHQSYSRAYIDFKRPEDVIDFAEFFNGHLFVNEKGTQFKAIVEYAPSQRVPKQWARKDGREGTISRDPEYLEFLEFIAKPVENLPSAEIQLERKEAERAGAAKDAPIVTPLMDFVRQKRAAKSGPRGLKSDSFSFIVFHDSTFCNGTVVVHPVVVHIRILSNGKLSRRAGANGSPGSSSSKRGSEKKRTPTTMYVLRDSAKNSGGKDKVYTLISKRDDQQISDKASVASASGMEALEDESGISGIMDAGKKKILLLKGKEKEISSLGSVNDKNMALNFFIEGSKNVFGFCVQGSGVDVEYLQVFGNMSQQRNAISSEKSLSNSTSLKSQRREASGRIIRSILLNKELRQGQSSVGQSEQHVHASNLEKEKRPPRPPHSQMVLKDSNGAPDDKIFGSDSHGFSSEKQEKRSRNKDRLDRVIWAPLRRSDGPYASDESLSSSQSAQSGLDSSLGNHGETKGDYSRGMEVKTLGGGRNSHSSHDNGSHKHFGRRGPSNAGRDGDGSSLESKPSKRSGAHEKQVWVQKSSSGS
ncbi:hypothetical protein Tsubulata_035600 [Turnera subulata]|uniref:UPF3 domain-containing protein n=1 Tax=Turnera subulata TaxID=218843 RepID=A0A9Q0GCN5_9ROSI|nr:hypothetical protein Tsubulata_035600 [Turnera subulata]